MTKNIKNHFKSCDPILYSYIEKIELIERTSSENLFLDLCESIISQQLSTKASDTIFGRMLKLIRGKLTPQKLLKLSDKKLRGCGISYDKIKYLKNLSSKISKKELILENLDKLSDEQIITELTKVKGIGRWTAEMFLMFSLSRQDIFSHGDLGLRRAIQKMYGFKKEPSVKQMEKIIKNWRPYRTYASRILWKSLELKLD